MIDFGKFKLPTGPRIEVLYRCDVCLSETWYVLALPEHLRRCFARRCDGALVEVERHEVPR